MSNDNTNKIHEIDIELQKLDVLINELEVAEKTDETIEEYLKLKEQYKELLNKRKALVPKKKTFWDKIPLWMYIYIVIQFILLAIPYLSQLIWVYFSSWLTEVFSHNWTNYYMQIFLQFGFNSLISLFIHCRL